MKNHTIKFFTLLVIGFLCLGLAQAALAKGKPVKVEVTAADPPDAYQGEEVDVTVSGSGFDSGSSVSYLVTGTTDAGQVDVISVQYVSDTELKTRIRPKDNAPVTDYDIEVQNSSGRKGKGTTLFRVKQAETACTGFEDKEPETVFLSGPIDEGDVITKDIYLSSASGCDQYLIEEAAQQHLPDSPCCAGTLISEVRNLRLDIRGDQGVIAWLDRYAGTPWPVFVLRFSLLADGTPIADPAGPQPHYLTTPESGLVVSGFDVRISETYELELVYIERPLDDYLDRHVAFYNLDTLIQYPIQPTPCEPGTCFERAASSWWNADGSQIYLYAYDPVAAESLTARYRYDTGQQVWLAERVINGSAATSPVSLDGLLAYARNEATYNKRGKLTGSRSVSRVIDPEDCVPQGCLPEEGLELNIDHETYADTANWTCDGGLIFQNRPSQGWYLTKIADPLGAGIVEFQLGPTDDPYQRDTRYCRPEDQ